MNNVRLHYSAHPWIQTSSWNKWQEWKTDHLQTSFYSHKSIKQRIQTIIVINVLQSKPITAWRCPLGDGAPCRTKKWAMTKAMTCSRSSFSVFVGIIYTQLCPSHFPSFHNICFCGIKRKANFGIQVTIITMQCKLMCNCPSNPSLKALNVNFCFMSLLKCRKRNRL